LDGDYRLLLDFNGTVLAAHQTRSGAEFVTWEYRNGADAYCKWAEKIVESE